MVLPIYLKTKHNQTLIKIHKKFKGINYFKEIKKEKNVERFILNRIKILVIKQNIKACKRIKEKIVVNYQNQERTLQKNRKRKLSERIMMTKSNGIIQTL